MSTPICVLRSGGDFLPEHAHMLAAGIVGVGGLQRPVVLTDLVAGDMARPLRHIYPGWWAKMELFAPWNQELGDLLYFDLDTVIVGSLRDLANANRLTMLRDFYKPVRMASGMMFLPASVRSHVWDVWTRDPIAHMQRYVRGGDGAFLEAVLIGCEVQYWQESWPNQVVSYKVHVRPHGLHPDAKVVCYHGRPRPWSAEHPTRDELIKRTASSYYAGEKR